MVDKAYIVANKEQALDVLKRFERRGFKWGSEELPTEFIFSDSVWFDGFPYVITEHKDVGYIGWTYDSQYFNADVVYDGRKEEKMYKVTQEFMDELIEWRGTRDLDTTTGDFLSHVAPKDLDSLPSEVETWWYSVGNSVERNRRLIAIIQWLNGEDVFEVEEQHKFIVRSDKKDHDGYYAYVAVENDMTTAAYTFVNATKFDTREEAQEWANSHQVVVEIYAEGNEVE